MMLIFALNIPTAVHCFFDGEVVSQDCPAQFFAGNRFYTTTANQLLRHWQPNIVTVEEARQWISQYV